MRIRYGFVSNSSSCSFIIPTSLYNVNIKACYALLKRAIENYIYFLEYNNKINKTIENIKQNIDDNNYISTNNSIYELIKIIEKQGNTYMIGDMITDEMIDNTFEICSKNYHNIKSDMSFEEQKNYINMSFYHKNNYKDFTDDELIDIYNIDVFRKNINDDDIIITPLFEDNENPELMSIISETLNTVGIRLS